MVEILAGPLGQGRHSVHLVVEAVQQESQELLSILLAGEERHQNVYRARQSLWTEQRGGAYLQPTNLGACRWI